MSLPRFSPKRLKEIADGKRNADGTKKRTGLEDMKKSGLVSKASSFTSKPRKRIKPRSTKNKGGQVALFKRIWDTRKHQCEVCGAYIEEATASNFSHLLPKGTYPDFKLNERNVMLKCKSCHDKWHLFGPQNLMKLSTWKSVCAKYEQLRREANRIEP